MGHVNADRGAIIARARRKTPSPSAHPGSRPAGLLVLLLLFKTCRVSTTLVINTAGKSEINTAGKYERPRRSLYDDMARPFRTAASAVFRTARTVSKR